MNDMAKFCRTFGFSCEMAGFKNREDFPALRRYKSSLAFSSSVLFCLESWSVEPRAGRPSAARKQDISLYFPHFKSQCFLGPGTERSESHSGVPAFPSVVFLPSLRHGGIEGLCRSQWCLRANGL